MEKHKDNLSSGGKQKKIIFLIPVLLFVLLLVFTVSTIILTAKSDPLPETPEEAGYDREWIIGKDISEIQEKYGEFDHVYYTDKFQVRYRSASYDIKVEQGWIDDYFGALKKLHLVINFDGSGTATGVYLHEEW